MTRPLHELTAVEAAREIREGQLAAAALLEACLERLDVTEPGVAAWVTVDRDGARATARRLDEEAAAGRLRGPLHGVPVGLKDIIHAAGILTTAGARGFVDLVPSEDAPCVARLREAGAVIVGKTHTTEFAYSDPAVTSNPWSPDRTPGGSSSGSAAAVAARSVPIALGTQTRGSVLRPAAFCGVVGYKPTYGRISRRGVWPVAWTLDTVGVLARSVADVALVGAVLSGFDPRDPGSLDLPPPDVTDVTGDAPRDPPRLGLVGALRDQAGPPMAGALDRAARLLAERGARVEAVRLPAIMAPLHAALLVIMRAEVAAVHAELYPVHAERYRPRMRSLVESGQLVPASLYLRAQQIRALARRELGAILAAHDALLVPAAPGPAPDLSTTGDAVFNAPWTGLGAPAIALPMELAEGLPLGLQLVAAPGADARLLRAARWVEAVLDFRACPQEPVPT